MRPGIDKHHIRSRGVRAGSDRCVRIKPATALPCQAVVAHRGKQDGTAGHANVVKTTARLNRKRGARALRYTRVSDREAAVLRAGNGRGRHRNRQAPNACRLPQVRVDHRRRIEAIGDDLGGRHVHEIGPCRAGANNCFRNRSNLSLLSSNRSRGVRNVVQAVDRRRNHDGGSSDKDELCQSETRLTVQGHAHCLGQLRSTQGAAGGTARHDWQISQVYVYLLLIGKRESSRGSLPPRPIAA